MLGGFLQTDMKNKSTLIKIHFDFIITNLHFLSYILRLSYKPSSVRQTSRTINNKGLFISPSGISELDCATTKTDMAERSMSICTESLQVFFVLGALKYFQVPPLGVVVTKNGVHSE